jgi:hypothetical protein
LLLGASVVASAQEGAPIPSPAEPGVVAYTIALNGENEVPPVSTSATGTAEVIYYPDISTLSWSIVYEGLSGPATAAHFHGPAGAGENAEVVIPLGESLASPIIGEVVLTEELIAMLDVGDLYLNIHTEANPGGEIRGQLSFTSDLIRELQTLLTQQGFDPEGIDGILGPMTRASVTEAQQSFGLPADGEPTVSLLIRLRAVVGAEAVVPEPAAPGDEVVLPAP